MGISDFDSETGDLPQVLDQFLSRPAQFAALFVKALVSYPNKQQLAQICVSSPSVLGLVFSTLEELALDNKEIAIDLTTLAQHLAGPLVPSIRSNGPHHWATVGFFQDMAKRLIQFHSLPDIAFPAQPSHQATAPTTFAELLALSPAERKRFIEKCEAVLSPSGSNPTNARDLTALIVRVGEDIKTKFATTEPLGHSEVMAILLEKLRAQVDPNVLILSLLAALRQFAFSSTRTFGLFRQTTQFVVFTQSRMLRSTLLV